MSAEAVVLAAVSCAATFTLGTIIGIEIGNREVNPRTKGRFMNIIERIRSWFHATRPKRRQHITILVCERCGESFGSARPGGLKRPMCPPCRRATYNALRRANGKSPEPVNTLETHSSN